MTYQPISIASWWVRGSFDYGVYVMKVFVSVREILPLAMTIPYAQNFCWKSNCCNLVADEIVSEYHLITSTSVSSTRELLYFWRILLGTRTVRWWDSIPLIFLLTVLIHSQLDFHLDWGVDSSSYFHEYKSRAMITWKGRIYALLDKEKPFHGLKFTFEW